MTYGIDPTEKEGQAGLRVFVTEAASFLFQDLPRRKAFSGPLPHAQLFSSAPSEAHRERVMSGCKFPFC